MEVYEIIKDIKVLKSMIEWDYSITYQIALEQALKVLEKEIPKEVIDVDKKGCYGGTLKAPHCPNCFNNVTEGKRCKHCGQVLRWKNEGEL